MHTLVIGGTGFLGYYVVNELLRQGHEVTVLCRNPQVAEHLFIKEVHFIKGDINRLNLLEMEQILKNVQGLVFAAGVDERAKPAGDVYSFFHQANVVTCERLFYAARHSPVTHAVLLNSIFGYMDRMHPELQVAKHHPYVRSRVEQARISLAIAQDAFALTVLEVPWVFGASHRARHPWVALINYVRAIVPLLVTAGGANMMSTNSVAQAVYGALTYPTKSRVLPIGDTNMSWQTLLEHICVFVNRKDCNINLISDRVFKDMTRTGGTFKDLLGIGSGMDTAHLPDIILNETFYNAEESRQLLKYQTGDLLKAIRETAESTPEHQLLKSWRKSMNLFLNL
jgi:nucleoside-diphosphate-sugar epimerase